MKQPKLAKWSIKPELEGLLLFAQTLDEMLFHHTVDLFKAPALNLHTSVLELRYLASQMINGRIRAGALIPILEEFESKLKNDPVINTKEDTAFVVYLEHIKGLKNNAQELLPVCDALQDELQRIYWARLRTQILKAVSTPGQKGIIIALAETFVAEAELQGFGRGFIYYKTQNFFFEENGIPREISSVNQIADFLDIFDQPSFEWKVIFRGCNTFQEMADYAKYFNLQILSQCPDGVPGVFRSSRLLAESKDFPLYIVADKIKHRDPISARDVADGLIDTLSAVYSFLRHEEQMNVSDESLVINTKNNETTILKPLPNPMKCGLQRISDVVSIKQLIEILAGAHLEMDSARKFARSIEYHQAALETKIAENQLLDLWASLEGFVPPPSKDDERIGHYVSTLLPSLTLTYLEKVLRYLSDSLYYGGDKIRQLVDGSRSFSP